MVSQFRNPRLIYGTCLNFDQKPPIPARSLANCLRSVFKKFFLFFFSGFGPDELAANNDLGLELCGLRHFVFVGGREGRVGRGSYAMLGVRVGETWLTPRILLLGLESYFAGFFLCSQGDRTDRKLLCIGPRHSCLKRLAPVQLDIYVCGVGIRPQHDLFQVSFFFLFRQADIELGLLERDDDVWFWGEEVWKVVQICSFHTNF